VRLEGSPPRLVGNRVTADLKVHSRRTTRDGKRRGGVFYPGLEATVAPGHGETVFPASEPYGKLVSVERTGKLYYCRGTAYVPSLVPQSRNNNNNNIIVAASLNQVDGQSTHR
jgi:hypothetical protein